ncbi:Fatty acid synthase [Araneus ventricosus]|uniref:Fatty acid synthase n=1 Tax=Araneus ventricosus TaxID=182803 RepID=A0A4Y2HJ96_ARAVE|nr:Fatty acid synthase [Araneus ventricosus]
MVLAAYWRGKSIEDSNLETGAMALLGITWCRANKCCPKHIFPSCHNDEDSVTVSGPKYSVKEVPVDALIAKSVFVREVDRCGYAFHSQCVLSAVGKLQTSLGKVIHIHIPKPRTSRWISSCYPKQKWEEPSAKLVAAFYFVKSFASPVLFHEALHHIPKDVVVIEIVPHQLLQRVIGTDAEYEKQCG